MNDLELPDVNVLLALLHPAHVHHRPACEWFASVARFGTTPTTEAGFVRVALNPKVSGGPANAAAVIASLRSIRAHPRAEFLPDDSSLAEPELDLAGLSGFRQLTDFHLVNLAARHRARLVTFDRKIKPTLMPEEQHWVRTLG